MLCAARSDLLPFCHVTFSRRGMRVPRSRRESSSQVTCFGDDFDGTIPILVVTRFMLSLRLGPTFCFRIKGLNVSLQVASSASVGASRYYTHMQPCNLSTTAINDTIPFITFFSVTLVFFQKFQFFFIKEWPRMAEYRLVIPAIN